MPDISAHAHASLSRSWKLAVFSALACLAAPDAQAFTLSVVDGNGNPVGAFQWLVEEDATRYATPGVTTPADLSVNFHPSYMPVVARGDEANTVIAVDPSKRYFVSVVPDSGYTLGGAPVAPGQASVTVVVNPQPIPTAQITVLAFEDNFPINSAPNQPAERGLGGFTVMLEDPGGRYGHVGGQVTMDAFGNPLGTTYDAAGNVVTMGSGIIRTGPDGTVTIKNLSPGKYGVIVVPPPGQGWQQTSTIEGTPVIDAWVKPNEPAFFQEFGPPGYHVFVGFIQPFRDAARLGGGSTVSGQVVNDRLARPPDYAFYDGPPFGHTNCWVGLNEGALGTGPGLLAQRCGPDGTFSITGVPPGDYQLVVWDDNLDLIFTFLGLTVPAGGAPIVLGDVPVFSWFAGLHQYVFNDENENGVWDAGEMPLSEVPTNIRFRDGTVYQSFPTDMEGVAPYDEVFPFFAWLVAEVDFTRYKATGATIVVDGGGPTDPTNPWAFEGVLAPQAQPDNLGLPYRVETGPVLTQGFQAFLGQTNVIQWGKKAYGPGENGGISGVVYYAVTRAENDPALAAVEPWEPGIPRVQVNLYADADGDGVIDDLNGDLQVTPADVDNAPFGWQDDPLAIGPEDVDHDGSRTFDMGDALRVTHTDSWDDNVPTGCPGDPADPFYFDAKCYDGMRNWNQVRPGVFDGGYAFGSPEDPLPAGIYVVEAVPPRSAYGATYEIAKEEDKNVDFGDQFVGVANVPPACVGDLHDVPAFLSLFPGQEIPAPFAGTSRPLCDRKQVLLTGGFNAAVDFPMFTPVPVAGHIVGFVLDDNATEFNRASPQFGEKFAPPWIPISIRDWTGREFSRVYTDSNGTYSALVPSTYTMDRPAPTGVAPNMLTVCLNDPAMPDPASPDGFSRDPFYNPQYSQFCYTFQYTPGTTTYLDTPVVHIAAFAGPDQFPLDCAYADGTPRLHSVNGPLGGPLVRGNGETLTIVSMGQVAVPNPAFDPADPTSTRSIPRDYGFGTVPGTVTLPAAAGGEIALTIVSWAPDRIVATVPGTAATGQLTVTRGDNGKSTLTGVTVSVTGSANVFWVPAGGRIQDVIDDPAVRPGALVIVPPGNYEELVVLWKPVRLQGSGEGSTFIDAVKAPAEKLQAWRQRVQTLVTSGVITLLPGQAVGGAGALEPDTLFNEEGAGILVLARDASVNQGGFGLVEGIPNARIDGFTLTGADHGGAVVVNGYAHWLQVSNNRIAGNSGVYGGGVRVGHPLETTITTAFNDHVSVFNNQLVANGGLRGAGGGLSLYAGSDAYVVRDNLVCGNFSMGDGAGIGHQGLSDGGLIQRNTVIFNQSFNQGLTVSGGGILVAGETVPLGGLSPGSGSVTIDGNLIRGNQAGAGDGGGVRVSRASGADVARSRNRPTNWYHVELVNNVITHNVAGLAGGGISLQDAPRVTILHNTIAHNDSTATAGAAFAPGSPSLSTAQPAGIVARRHSPELAAQFGNQAAVAPYRVFSNPTLNGNVVWQNRSFYFEVNDLADPPQYLLQPRVASPYWDLAVLGTTAPASLSPVYSLLTDPTGTSATNRTGPPSFVSEFLNGSRASVVAPDVTTPLTPAPAFDEGGNFIDVQYGPLTLWDPAGGALFGDYHIQPGSAAVGIGDPNLLRTWPEAALDFDGEARPPVGTAPDAGADELP